jgi:regulator of sigma D
MPNSEYREDVIVHINKVAILLLNISSLLHQRAASHDRSKFSAEEFAIYEQVVPKLKAVEYGSEEYKEAVKLLGPALQHHYQENRHHPEHFANGVNDMNVLDVLEMLCDWAAVSPDLNKSLEVNKERFSISDQLFQIIKNTVSELNSH